MKINVIKKFLPFIFASLIALWIVFPYHNFQPFLSQADNGRDLYGFEQTLKGGQPYQDYWWVYGPLMPYYYALISKILGVCIQSVFIAKIILMLLSAVFFYLAISVFADRLFSLVAALWFLTFNRFVYFTYNHVGGICASLAFVYFLFCYLKTQRKIYAFWGFGSIFILFLIKLNFGLSALLPFMITLFCVDRYSLPGESLKNLRLWGVLCLATLTSSLLIYLYFLRGLPLYAIKQCLPYLPKDHPMHASPVLMLINLLHFNISHVFSSLPNLFFGFILILSGINIIISLKNKKIEGVQKPLLIGSIAATGLIFIFYLHEFLLSGVNYRLFWSTPLLILFNFLILNFGTSSLSKTMRFLLLGTLILIICLRTTERNGMIASYKIPPQYMAYKKAHIYVANSQQWLSTVNQTLNFLNANLKENETFFALPFDPLYYFLANKKSPTRQLIFFEHINIPKEQEEKIITELESNHANYVLLSSRENSSVTGLGKFGTDYCPLLYKYINENFKEVAMFGDWSQPPTTSWENHGTKIFKRISG